MSLGASKLNKIMINKCNKIMVNDALGCLLLLVQFWLPSMDQCDEKLLSQKIDSPGFFFLVLMFEIISI